MSQENLNEQIVDDENIYQVPKLKRIKRTPNEIHEEKKQAYLKSLAKKRDKNKKLEDRKKFLLGDYLMYLMAKTEENNEFFLDGLDGYLKRDEDRKLFGLSSLENDKKIE